MEIRWICFFFSPFSPIVISVFTAFVNTLTLRLDIIFFFTSTYLKVQRCWSGVLAGEMTRVGLSLALKKIFVSKVKCYNPRLIRWLLRNVLILSLEDAAVVSLFGEFAISSTLSKTSKKISTLTLSSGKLNSVAVTGTVNFFSSVT